MPTKPSGCAIDLAVLIELVGDDPDTLAEMLDEFRASVADQQGQLRTAAASGDRMTLTRNAHSMKGAARYAGASTLARICDTIEVRAKGTDALDAFGGDLAALDAAVAQLPAAIADALAMQRSLVMTP